MNGDIGYWIKAAENSPFARQRVSEVFGEDFQTWGGWTEMLDHMPGGSVDILLNRRGTWWTRESFQALYVSCWIHHPVEKGSYMIQLVPAHYANVKDAYEKLLSSGGLQSRISSHLSKTGASAHKGWKFLRGYGELLVQIEGEENSAPYLFLKCEGHALDGLSFSTIMHGASWVVKEITGAGAMASPALHDWAASPLRPAEVEERAAENFSKSYKKLLKQLELSGKKVTVEEVMDQLVRRAGFDTGIPPQIRKNTQTLGRSMLGPLGYIALFKRRKDVLKKNKVDFNEKVEKELTGLAERMTAAAVAHPLQHYNEVRVTPLELDTSLGRFWGYRV